MRAELTKAQEEAVALLLRSNIDASQGLPEELFLLVSALSPVPNVDLLIRDDSGRILLSWRDDDFYGEGWHIPGGCIRFGESFENRIQQTAMEELGCQVTFNPKPIAVRNVLRGPRKSLKNPNVRGHNVTILYECTLPDHFCVNNNGKTESMRGYLKWFDTLPDNLLAVHSVYDDILRTENTGE